MFIGHTGNRYKKFSEDHAMMTARNGFGTAGQSMMSPVMGNSMNSTFSNFNTVKKERFGGEENDGNNDGPIMQKRFKRTTAHFFA